MSDIKKLTNLVVKFRNDRNWKQFHNPKDMALSLTLEATEVLEHFQWRNEEEVKKYLKKHKKEVGDEIADVLYWAFLMAHDLEINIPKAFIRKMKDNVKRYPVKKVKGKYYKYTEYQK